MLRWHDWEYHRGGSKIGGLLLWPLFLKQGLGIAGGGRHWGRRQGGLGKLPEDVVYSLLGNGEEGRGSFTAELMRN